MSSDSNAGGGGRSNGYHNSSSGGSGGNSLLSARFVVKFMAVPYLIGYVISTNNVELVRKLFLTMPLSLIGHPAAGYNRLRQSLEENRLLATEDDVELCYLDLIRSAAPPPSLLQTQPAAVKGVDDDDAAESSSTMTPEERQEKLALADLERIYGGLSLVVHRNGEAAPCGETGATTDLLNAAFKRTIRSMERCPNLSNRYQFDAFLTRLLQGFVSDGCYRNDAASDPDSYDEEEEEASQNGPNVATMASSSSSSSSYHQRRRHSRRHPMGFYGYCYRGEENTPILPDHGRMVPLKLADVGGGSGNGNSDGKESKYYPCHYHNEHGQLISSLWHLTMDAARGISAAADSKTETQLRKLNLHAVPAGRHFMFAPSRVGQVIDLPHVKGANPAKGPHVTLKVLSVQPRVFEVSNLFTADDADAVIRQALSETREALKLQRSSTGIRDKVGYPTQRTSESAFVLSGEAPMSIKRRAFAVAGFEDFLDTFSDGLQFLRYNRTKAYDSHLDYVDFRDKANDENTEHDYDSARKGGNRMIAFVLYFNDMNETDGGETVFTNAWSPGQAREDRVRFRDALRQLRESGDATGILKGDSWQEHLVATCRSRLAIKPETGKAIMFYLQHPNGREDRTTMHAACPVLSGTKSTPRDGTRRNPKNPNFKGVHHEHRGNSGPKKIATFHNTGKDPTYAEAELYIGDEFWSKLGAKDPPVSVNTFEGHLWHLKVKGKTAISWSIGKDKKYWFSI